MEKNKEVEETRECVGTIVTISQSADHIVLGVRRPDMPGLVNFQRDKDEPYFEVVCAMAIFAHQSQSVVKFRYTYTSESRYRFFQFLSFVGIVHQEVDADALLAPIGIGHD